MGFRGMSVGLLAAAVLVAGCGSSSNTTSAGSAPAAGTTGAGGTTTAGPQVTTTSSAGTPSFASSQNCQQLAGLGAKYAQAFEAAARGGTFNLSAEVTAYQNLANVAPSAIRPDVQLAAQAFSSFASAVSKTGYTIGKVPTASQLAALQSAVQVFSQPQVRAAAQRISVWARQNCG